MSILQLPNGKFRVQIRRTGFPKFDKVFLSREAAEEAQASVLGEQRAVAVPTELTLSGAWAKYCQSQSFLQKADKTRSTEAGRIQPVLTELGSYSLHNLQNAPSLIYDYIDKRSNTISSRTKKKLSTTSVRLEVAALSAVVAFAKQRKIVQSNFVRQIDRPAQAKRKRRVGTVELAGLGNAAKSHDTRIAEAARFALVLRFAGCRPGELARLRRDDVSLSDETLIFRNTKFKSEDRRIHLTPRTVSLLNAQFYQNIVEGIESEYVFSTRAKTSTPEKPVYVHYNYESAIKLLRRHDIVEKSFHAHAMRREYISRAIETNMEYSTIKKLTGHHSSQAIEIYDEGLSTAPEIREALNRHEQVINEDELIGVLTRMGMTPVQVKEALAKARGEYVSPNKVVLLKE